MTQARKIRLTFLTTGESVLADLLHDEAPGVCEHVWNLLPLENNLIHGSYSGPEVILLVPNPTPTAPENQVHLPLPGELLYFFDPGTSVEAGKNAVGELCIVYGRGAVLHAPESVRSSASLFARIPGDWKHDWVDFARACRKVRWEGPQRLRIEKA